PNMTGVLGRTATHAMSNATWPFITQIATIGIEKSLEQNPALKNGVYIHQGKIVNQVLTDALKGRKNR
ncbi:MAG: hypothetical protein MUO54_10915, partial [Anaerolineales bacterium]|nr:hypothetical protein [Anaerolineales bacterium]